MPEIIIPIVNNSSHPLPAYATPGSAGLDLRANIEFSITLASLERYMVPTGLFIQIPEGYEGQVRPRSGLAHKQGLTCLNSPGTIDSDYRGELKVILVNLSTSVQTIHPGDRIAQLVFSKVERAAWEPAQELNNSSRGHGGFGHTGNK